MRAGLVRGVLRLVLQQEHLADCVLARGGIDRDPATPAWALSRSTIGFSVEEHAPDRRPRPGTVLFRAPSTHAAKLFDRLGGFVGIIRIVDRAVEPGLADPHLAGAFDDTDVDQLTALIGGQFFNVTGGPGEPRQRSVYAAYAYLDLTTLHFNALVEDLQQPMDAEDFPFPV